MKATGIIAATAFAIVLALAPLVERFCLRWQILDWPGPLKPHARPTPRLGGVTIAFAIAGATLVSGRPLQKGQSLFFVALGLVWIVGLADDLVTISPAFRLAIQIAAGALLWCGGWHLPKLGVGFLDSAATCLYVVSFANAFNFLDGSDGLATGVAGIIALAYASIRASATSPLGFIVAPTMIGACTGFLPFNWPVARIYLGDSGSSLLGVAIAFLGLEFFRSHSAAASALLVPFLAAALPQLDAGLAIIRRIRKSQSPFHGDRAHAYDLLLARGWSPRRVALTWYGITAALCTLAWMAVRKNSWGYVLIALGCLLALLVQAIRLGALGNNTREPRLQEMQPVPKGGPTEI